MAEPTTRILDIPELIETRSVRIAGNLYPFRSELLHSIIETAKIRRQWARINELLRTIDVPTDEQAVEVSRLLDEFVHTVLNAPEAVLEKLTDSQRLDIGLFFTGLPARMQALVTGAIEGNAPDPNNPYPSEIPTGSASSAPVASGTAAIPGIG